MKATKGTGNVFADLGFGRVEAETLAVKSDLVSLVARAIRLRGLTQSEAAKLCGTDQGTLSKALSGKMQSLTIERLAKWLLALGWNVKIEASPGREGRKTRRGAFSVHASFPHRSS